MFVAYKSLVSNILLVPPLKPAPPTKALSAVKQAVTVVLPTSNVLGKFAGHDLHILAPSASE